MRCLFGLGWGGGLLEILSWVLYVNHVQGIKMFVLGMEVVLVMAVVVGTRLEDGKLLFITKSPKHHIIFRETIRRNDLGLKSG